MKLTRCIKGCRRFPSAGVSAAADRAVMRRNTIAQRYCRVSLILSNRDFGVVVPYHLPDLGQAAFSFNGRFFPVLQKRLELTRLRFGRWDDRHQGGEIR